MISYTYDDLLSPGFFHNLTLFQPVEAKFDERNPKDKEVIITNLIANTFSCLNSPDKVFKFIGGSKNIAKEKEYLRQVRLCFLIRCALWQSVRDTADEKHYREQLRNEMIAMLHARLREIAAAKWAIANDEFELDRIRIENEALENILRELHEDAMNRLREYEVVIRGLTEKIAQHEERIEQLTAQLISQADKIAEDFIQDQRPDNPFKNEDKNKVANFFKDYFEQINQIHHMKAKLKLLKAELAAKGKGGLRAFEIDKINAHPEVLKLEKSIREKERELIVNLAHKHDIGALKSGDDKAISAVNDMMEKHKDVSKNFKERRSDYTDIHKYMGERDKKMKKCSEIVKQRKEGSDLIIERQKEFIKTHSKINKLDENATEKISKINDENSKDMDVFLSALNDLGAPQQALPQPQPQNGPRQ